MYLKLQTGLLTLDVLVVSYVSVLFAHALTAG